MAITINIEGVDRTTKVEYDSFELQRALTSQVDTLKFKIIRHPDSSYAPTILDDVEVLDGSQQIFGGQIVELNRSIIASDKEVFECTCKDYSYDMDRNLVIQSYTNETIADIIEDIKDNFLPAGYNTDNVDCELVAGYVAFNYEYPSKCLQQLADLVNFDWYVDGDKNIYFFSKSTYSAPFNLTDDNGMYYYNSLILKEDVKSLRNTIIVRGGSYEGSTVTESQVADGEALIYKQGYQYSNVVVEVEGVEQNVGIDNIDAPEDFDVLYNYQEKFVRFKDSTKPANGDLVEVSGNPNLPVIVKVRESNSIAQYGVHEYKIVDKSLNSKQGARDRAKAEIAGWANEIDEGSFDTKQSGLEVGQQINIQSDKRSLNRDFVISRINTRMINGQEFEHSVTLVTTHTYGMIEFLMQLITSKDKEIEIKANEVLDEVESADENILVTETATASITATRQQETISTGESTTVQALNYNVQFVWGPFGAPSTTKRLGKWNQSRWG